jgi:hypothetical protein
MNNKYVSSMPTGEGRAFFRKKCNRYLNRSPIDAVSSHSVHKVFLVLLPKLLHIFQHECTAFEGILYVKRLEILCGIMFGLHTRCLRSSHFMAFRWS